MNLKIRDRMEFSKEENLEFDFFETEFPKAEISLAGNKTTIHIVYQNEDLENYIDMIKEVEDKFRLVDISHRRDSTVITLDRGFTIPHANILTRLLVDIGDITCLNYRNCKVILSESQSKRLQMILLAQKMWIQGIAFTVKRHLEKN